MRKLPLALSALALWVGSPALADDVAAKIGALSPAAQAFVQDEARLALFHLTPAKLADAFRGRTPEEVAAYVASLMQVAQDAAFHPGRDASAIALNPGASGFNASTVLKPAMFDEFRRDPGPISLDHYLFQKTGIPTFAHAPVAIRREDLVAGKVEVAFIGVPLDFSSGWRDGKHGPMALRSTDGLVGMDAAAGVDPGTVLSLADFGDLSVDYMSVERSVDHVRFMVGQVAGTGAAPFVVGGDHAVMYPDVAAMVDTYGKGRFTLIQFDAHAEAEATSEHTLSDNQALHRLLADGVITGSQVVQVGTRGPETSSADTARLARAGVTMLGMERIEKDGWDSVAAKVIAAAKAGPGAIFVSFDMSVLDPAYAAGAGRPVQEGLTMREAVPLIRSVCASGKVIGFELLDSAPILDPTYRSAQAGNAILHACLAGVAQRKVAEKKG